MLSVVIGAILAASASAAQVWFYETQSPPYQAQVTKPRHQGQSTDRHWLLVEFEEDPFPGQLTMLERIEGFSRADLVFRRPPLIPLVNEYARLAKTWASKGVEQITFKFVGSLPSAPEADILKPVCATQAKIVFITTQIPTSDEIQNLNELGPDCVRVQFALSRYLRDEDLESVRGLKDIPFTMINDHFPASIHVENLNRLSNSISLWINRTLPDADQLKTMATIEHLKNVFLDFDLVPTEEQYQPLFQWKKPGLTLRWSFGDLRKSDVEAWSKMTLDRVQVPATAFQNTQIEGALRTLNTEVLVEFF